MQCLCVSKDRYESLSIDMNRFQMQFGRDVPGYKQRDEEQDIPPMKQFSETQPRFAIEDTEQNENRQGINQTEQTFRETRERAADPDAEKPASASASPMITTNPAKNRAGNERAEHRFRHDNPAEQ